MKIIAVEPKSSPVLSTGVAGKHKIQGVGAGFVPQILDRSAYDEVIAVTDEDAFATGRLIDRRGGWLESHPVLLYGLLLRSRKGLKARARRLWFCCLMPETDTF